MSVAVIIPCYNRAALLARAVDSVLAQTTPPDEIIVVDDGSTDTTASLIRTRYGAKVQYIHQVNTGVSAARNNGIRAAHADWLTFLDSDDEWLPEKLDQQWRVIQSEPHCWIVHGDEIWIRDGHRVNPMAKHAKCGGMIYQHCLPLCAISPSAVMIHREVFTAIGLFDESLPVCEDYDLWLRITARYPVHYIPRALIVKYGGHADQLSRRHWGMDRFRITSLVKMLESGALGATDSAATVQTLQKKIDVYLQGARKRGKHEEVALYTSLKQNHCQSGALV